MPVTEQTFLQLALEEPNQWELYCGRLRRKPAMTAAHNFVAYELGLSLGRQLDRSKFHVRVGMGHARRSAENYFIPDVFVVPAELVRPLLDQRNVLEAYRAPLPLVVEVWSPSTGDYDVDPKIPEYKARGDLEIWRLHPFDHTLTAWRRQPDGSYEESHYLGGRVQLYALTNVSIDLDTLFG
jgi:Uma2 family endonuclease